MFCEFASCHKIVVSPKIVLRLSQDRLWIWAQDFCYAGALYSGLKSSCHDDFF